MNYFPPPLKKTMSLPNRLVNLASIVILVSTGYMLGMPRETRMLDMVSGYPYPQPPETNNCTRPVPVNFTCVEMPANYVCIPMYDIAACTLPSSTFRDDFILPPSQVDTTICLFNKNGLWPSLCGNNYQKIAAGYNMINNHP